MNEQLLKMNGLSVEILDALSFESHLGIPLKKNPRNSESLICQVEKQWMTDTEVFMCTIKKVENIIL